MATLPPETILSNTASVHPADGAPEALGDVLAALHGKAASLALLARIGAEPGETAAALAALAERAHPWQRALVAQGVADCAAMLEAGFAALTTLSARGQDTAAPALALWREFHAARTAMQTVLTTSQAA